MEQEADTVVPIAMMQERLEVSRDVLDIGMNFRRMNIAPAVSSQYRGAEIT